MAVQILHIEYTSIKGVGIKIIKFYSPIADPSDRDIARDASRSIVPDMTPIITVAMPSSSFTVYDVSMKPIVATTIEIYAL